MAMPNLKAVTIFSLELEAARQLQECLQREQDHLVEADLRALAVNTEQKNGLVAHLEMLATQRLQAIAAAGYPETDEGVQAWLKTQNDAVRGDWDQLMALAASGKEWNRLNGILINQHMVRVQNALQAVRGGTGQPAVYGPNGQQNTKAPGRKYTAG